MPADNKNTTEKNHFTEVSVCRMPISKIINKFSNRFSFYSFMAFKRIRYKRIQRNKNIRATYSTIKYLIKFWYQTKKKSRKWKRKWIKIQWNDVICYCILHLFQIKEFRSRKNSRQLSQTISTETYWVSLCDRPSGNVFSLLRWISLRSMRLRISIFDTIVNLLSPSRPHRTAFCATEKILFFTKFGVIFCTNTNRTSKDRRETNSMLFTMLTEVDMRFYV